MSGKSMCSHQTYKQSVINCWWQAELRQCLSRRQQRVKGAPCFFRGWTLCYTYLAFVEIQRPNDPYHVHLCIWLCAWLAGSQCASTPFICWYWLVTWYNFTWTSSIQCLRAWWPIYVKWCCFTFLTCSLIISIQQWQCHGAFSYHKALIRENLCCLVRSKQTGCSPTKVVDKSLLSTSSSQEENLR